MSQKAPLPNKYKKSLSLYKSSLKHLVPGGSTISKRPDLYPFKAYPIYIDKCFGAKVIDIDGNLYADFQSSLGAVLLGYNHKYVIKAISNQLKKGVLLPLSNSDVVKLAEKLCSLIPAAERVRILKNGSDATSGAVRIARAYTKKNKILACHYHGWHDWFYISTNMNKGIPDSLRSDIISFEYNNLSQLEDLFSKHRNQIAAIIMEPAHLEAPQQNYLQKVQKIARKHGALLIFDEVVTGFRYGIGGAQGYFGVIPDLACFAKALGNGSPISAIVGNAKIMDNTKEVVTTQTYAEDCLAVVAAIATLEVLSSEPVVEYVWQLGQLFKDGFNELSHKYKIPAECVGFPPRLQINFNSYRNLSSIQLKSFLLQETARDNILIGHMIFINYAHTKKDIDYLLMSIEKIFKQLIKIEKKEFNLVGDLMVELW